jgi:hypothetical protein
MSTLVTDGVGLIDPRPATRLYGCCEVIILNALNSTSTPEWVAHAPESRR